MDKSAKWEHEVRILVTLEQQIRKRANLFCSRETHSQFSAMEIKCIEIIVQLTLNSFNWYAFCF